jgi:hypothetical protein
MFWNLIIKDSADSRIADLITRYKLWNRDTSVIDKLTYRLLVFCKDFEAWNVV